MNRATAAAQAIPDFQSLFASSGILAKPELAQVKKTLP